MPAAKKAPGTRARRNVASTAATLPAKPTRRGRRPMLPRKPGGWHPSVLAWWADMWASPMSEEYHRSDVHQLYMLAELYEAFWRSESPSMRKELASEIRHHRMAFGMTPYDRRRLEWTIEATESAKAAGKKRRAAEKPTPPPAPADDPRQVLRVVNGG